MTHLDSLASGGISRRSFVAGMGTVLLAGASAAFLSACGSSSVASSAASSSAAASSTAAVSSSAVAASSSAAASAGAAASSSSAAVPAAGTVRGRTLVAYYSAQGHTERAAQELADALGADLFEIVPANPYSDEDLDYNDDDSRVVREYQDESIRDLALAQDAPDNFAEYQTVLVGYPIWWGDASWAMWSFASENDFSGKTVVPFCTSYSSGIGESGQTLADLAGTGDWQQGMRFSQSFDDSEVREWAAALQA